MNATTAQFRTLPTWTPTVRTNGLGHFTPEQWALEDSATANRRSAMAAELADAVAAAERDGRATLGMLRRSLVRAIASAERAQVYCTKSGALRTECTTCDHSRQLEMFGA
ncbi:hypothetical protein ACUXZZ_45340 (plasmid) [Streptomyces graminifolii]|uniref:hypothetical protein n=1 Tax=Streptomyces graminifolii TaxID=1266771 RepID=UPI0040594325